MTLALGALHGGGRYRGRADDRNFHCDAAIRHDSRPTCTRGGGVGAGDDARDGLTLSSYSWGTRIDMNCTYGVHNSDHESDGQADDKLAIVVVGRDGSRSQVATWAALPGVTASLDGSTSAPVGQIAAIQVVSTATQDILLQRNLLMRSP